MTADPEPRRPRSKTQATAATSTATSAISTATVDMMACPVCVQIFCARDVAACRRPGVCVDRRVGCAHTAREPVPSRLHANARL